MSDVVAHPDKPWDWNGLSRKSNITMSDVDAHPDKPWDWNGLSRNPNITMSDVDAHPYKQWCWSWLSRYANITISDVFGNPDKPWDYRGLCSNPRTFTAVTTEDIYDHVRKRRATAVICQAVLRAFADPTYDYCRRRLAREHLQLTNVYL